MDIVKLLIDTGAWRLLEEGEAIQRGDIFVYDGHVRAAQAIGMPWEDADYLPHLTPTVERELNDMYAYYEGSD
jgi:hypothetical protein